MWKCTLCGDDGPEFDSKYDAKDHVRDNHVETLVAMSVEREENDNKFGHEPIE